MVDGLSTKTKLLVVFLELRRSLLKRNSWLPGLLVVFRYQARSAFGHLRDILRFTKPENNAYEIGINVLPTRCISLMGRVDRQSMVPAEAEKMGLENFRFFYASLADNPAEGCSSSHATVLMGEDSELPVFVIEDDFELVAEPEVFHHVVREFLLNPRLDVLCISYESGGRLVSVSDSLAIGAAILTTAAYIVKPRARKALAKAFRRSSSRLRSGIPSHLAAADVSWQGAQRTKLTFAVPSKKIARQRASFSNIERRWVDYETE